MSERIKLASRLDLGRSVALAQSLQAARGADVVLDASGVHFLGAHAVQTLMCARAAWASDGNALSLDAATPAVLQTLETLGLDPAAISARAPA